LSKCSYVPELVTEYNTTLNPKTAKPKGNSAEKLRHPRSVAYSVEHVLLNEHQILGGGAFLQCYQPK